jgi:hypothetical protein
MIVLFWCLECRALHAPGEVAFADDAGATMAEPRCARTGGVVELRGIPDDPDDERYGLPRCPTCRAEVRPTGRFCTRCGAALQTGPLPAGAAAPGAGGGEASPSTYRNSAQVLVEFARQRARRLQLATILELLAERPNYRQRPQPGDMAGDFDAWFDGGAVRYLTSITEYYFANGARASFHDLSLRKLFVELPDGAKITIDEPPVQPGFADQVLAAVVAECEQMLRPLQGQAMPPSAGRPPAQCMIVENTASGGRLDWLYDAAANTLTPCALGILDMSREPMDGMYYQRGLVQYRVADDRRTIEFSSTLGPRFGRGATFDVIEGPGGVRLANPQVLWIA